MVVLFEGVDRLGKTTQIFKIKDDLNDKPVHVHVCGKPPKFNTSNETLDYSKKFYESVFNVLSQNYNDCHFLYDRSHIGEVVYSPMYRHYDGSYVYEIEKQFAKNTEFWQQVYLITFIDEAENIIKRDDGASFTTNIDKKKKEIQAFIEATSKSNIIHKKIINIANKDIDAVYKEIKDFLNG